MKKYMEKETVELSVKRNENGKAVWSLDDEEVAEKELHDLLRASLIRRRARRGF